MPNGAEFDALVHARRSVRGFLDTPISPELMQQVFETARWSPSGTNVQPWHICVASGATRDRMRAEMLAAVERGDEARVDHPSDRRMGDPWQERRRQCARDMYGAMGIEWEDREGRGRAALRNFELFDAPHAAFMCIHEQFGYQSSADVGMFAQTLMLSLASHGLASCAQGTLRNYPDLVRETFGLPPEIKVLFGISFGYEDPDVPANDTRTSRAPLSETVQFLD